MYYECNWSDNYKMNLNKVFFNAVLNEISIEKDILVRIKRDDLNYVPVRVLKSLPLLDRYKIKKPLYFVINICYLGVVPFFYAYKLIKSLISSKRYYNPVLSYRIKRKVVVLANSRVYSLFQKINSDKNVTYFDVNQDFTPSESNHVSVKNILNYSDYFKAYIFSIASVVYTFVHLKDKANLLQTYMAYDWFLTYIALDKIKQDIDEVIFANHYDRWATMFDQLFISKKIVLLQHGLLPKDLELSYKLQNIDVIYRFNIASEELFKKLFKCKEVEFEKLDSTISLQEVDSNEKSILIIGQPQSMDREIDIIRTLKKGTSYEIYIKPHPLFATIAYESIEGIHLIKDKNFFPRVDLALSYESTLGLEYESSGVKVLWYKDLNKSQIINEIKNI